MNKSILPAYSEKQSLHLTRGQIVRVAVDLGARGFGGRLSEAEESLFQRCSHIALPRNLDMEAIRRRTREGEDILGDNWLEAATERSRSKNGMVYTPSEYVDATIEWVAHSKPTRIVDVGSGTGRFLLKAADVFTRASLVAVDIDPVATIITRARLAVIGCRRAKVLNADYLDLRLQPVAGITAYLGNPPYVRHQELSQGRKRRAYAVARQLGLSVSGLAGLHAHFLIATAAKASSKDIGCFVISSEWMQSDYGKVIRKLLIERLGLQVLHLLDPAATAFPGIGTTAAILGFRVGSQRPSVEVTLHTAPGTLGHANGKTDKIQRTLFTESKWNFIFQTRTRKEASAGTEHIRLKEVCAVHRGIATGQNDFFALTADDSTERGLNPWVRPLLTRASQVFDSSGEIRYSKAMKVLLCPSKNVDLSDRSSAALLDYLKWGESKGVHKRKLCTLRHPWWYLGNPTPAPILVTYMGHRPPAFALNLEKLLTLNVIHGIYPHVPLSTPQLKALIQYLNAHSESFLNRGRVYHNGLTKFEPHDLEAVNFPIPRVLKACSLVRMAGIAEGDDGA